MMVMAFLRQADFIFKAKYLSAIFTHRTVHVVGAFQDFIHTILESGDDVIMVIEVARFHKFNVRMAGGNFVRKAVDAVNQNA